MRTQIFLALSLALGCTKSPKPPAQQVIAAKSTEDVWAIAPDKTKVAVVLAPGSLRMLFGAGKSVYELAKQLAPPEEIAEFERETKTKSGKSFLDEATLSSLKIDLDKPAALFQTEDGKNFAILPVTSLDEFTAAVAQELPEEKDNEFLKKSKELCKEMSGFIVCTKDNAADLARIGQSSELADMVKKWPTQLRGHVEAFVSKDSIPKSGFAEFAGIASAIKFERGGAELHFRVLGKPPAPLAVGTEISSAQKSLDGKSYAGWFFANLAPYKPLLQMGAGPLVENLPPDMKPMLSAAISEFSGNLRGYSKGGDAGRLLLEFVGDQAKPLILAMCQSATKTTGLAAAATPNECRIDLPMGPATTTGRLMIAGNDLVLDFGTQKAVDEFEKASSSSITPPAFAVDALKKPMLLAAWGRFSLVPLLNSMTELAKQSEKFDDQAKLGFTIMALLNEFGIRAALNPDSVDFAMRFSSIWSNPDNVVAELLPALVELAKTGSDNAKLLAIAAKYPDSPFGQDVKAGGGGAIFAAAPIGVVAAIAIPAFMKYVNRSKSSEAQLFVRKIYDGARLHYMDPSFEPGSLKPAAPNFPSPSVGPTPPLGTCCKQADRKCAADFAQWNNPTWTALHFSIDDPHYYSYEYRVGKNQAGKPSFTALAYGDLDCDGEYSTFSMTGEITDEFPDGPPGSAELVRLKENE